MAAGRRTPPGLLARYRIPMIASQVVTSSSEAVAVAAELGGPVVLKAEAAGVVHKTEAGAVQVWTCAPRRMSAAAYEQLAARFGAGLQRMLLQPMVANGVETMVGVVQEPVFGPLVVFGLGGVATEVLGDHVARLSPLTDADADEMISGVRAAALLTGHRGSRAVDTAGLARILLRVSRLAADLPEVAELDLNPSSPGQRPSRSWTRASGWPQRYPGTRSCAGCAELTWHSPRSPLMQNAIIGDYVN